MNSIVNIFETAPVVPPRLLLLEEIAAHGTIACVSSENPEDSLSKIFASAPIFQVLVVARLPSVQPYLKCFSSLALPATLGQRSVRPTSGNYIHISI